MPAYGFKIFCPTFVNSTKETKDLGQKIPSLALGFRNISKIKGLEPGFFYKPLDYLDRSIQENMHYRYLSSESPYVVQRRLTLIQNPPSVNSLIYLRLSGISTPHVEGGGEGG
jgi:hypothetical protein